MPDPKTYKQHFESKHPKASLPAEIASAWQLIMCLKYKKLWTFLNQKRANSVITLCLVNNFCSILTSHQQRKKLPNAASTVVCQVLGVWRRGIITTFKRNYYYRCYDQFITPWLPYRMWKAHLVKRVQGSPRGEQLKSNLFIN